MVDIYISYIAWKYGRELLCVHAHNSQSTTVLQYSIVSGWDV